MSAPDAPIDLKAEQRDRLGCRILRRTRAGLLVGLYHNVEANLDADGGAWSTICEDHGGIVCHDTFVVARSWLSHPEEWCPTCQDARDGMMRSCPTASPSNAGSSPQA